ncbi:inositol monophosphatase family protein [Vannielia sp.]|uniref:inositol monophosphatase family protein n=1 Tax=Vannielia sp. TaxID=2813045 RepID=UPI00260E0F5E|nr:inositol monophosphatase family protein [Vannielia sp.]MDF1872416.1 inositol monophosphatase family protein [Vannielia sp.]
MGRDAITETERAAIRTCGAEMAEAARAAILPHFRQPLVPENKDGQGGFDPVTLADRAAEQAIREVLAQRRPEDGIIGEEYGRTPGTSGLDWIIDPIDGTRAFISGSTSWGVLIALADENGPFYGIIDQPYIAERFEGGLGVAALTGPRGQTPLKVRDVVDLAEATLFTTFPEVGTEADGAAFRRVSQQVRLTRYGLDCYAYALLALGQIDLVIEAQLQSYDIAAPIAVIEAAGGVVTDWEGGPVHEGGRALAAATPELHRAAMELLA